MTPKPRPLRSGPVIEALQEAGLMPPLPCGDVAIFDEYNGPNAGRMIIRFDCLADDRVIEALRNIKALDD